MHFCELQNHLILLKKCGRGETHLLIARILLFSWPFAFPFRFELGGTWDWPGLSLCQEPNQPLKVLGCGRQVKLLRDIPQPPQTYATKSDTQLKFGEQSLDLVPFASRAGIRWR